MSLSNSDIIRAINIIKRNINDLKLDLNGLVVLTEIGSGPYLFNPLIPLIAGAKETIIWCRDTQYGTADDICDAFYEVIQKHNITGTYTVRKNKRTDEDIERADVVTNSGMIRPIDASFISKMKKGAAVPIMYEAWEVREADVNVDACKFYEVKVAGTWENHPSINVFNYTGILSLKMLFDCNVEVYQSSIYIWSNDDFGVTAQEAILRNGASKTWMNTDIEVFYQNLHLIDALYICDYHETRTYFGKGGIFDVERIRMIKPDLSIIHLYGDVDFQLLLDSELVVYPKKHGKPSVMTFTLAYVGLEPILRLQTAGYKVGEDLIRNESNTLIQLL